MQITRQNLPDGTIKLTVTILKDRVKEIYGKELATVLTTIEVPGFRKGKAPKKLAEEKIDKKKLTERIAGKLIPEVYQEVIKKENLKPIVNPQIRLISANEDQDWQVEIQTCEAPEVSLGNYKDQIKKINAAGKIWTPDKQSLISRKLENKKPATTRLPSPGGEATGGQAETLKSRSAGRTENTEDKDQQMQRVLNALLQSIKVAIPTLLIENELNRRLATLINKTEKLGMSLEHYLTSINQTAEGLRENYKKETEEFWKLELILNKIADEEKVSVEQAEIEKVIRQAKDEKEKRALESQKYFLAQVLRRQKTLDFLLNL